jgi:hypothetical protein
MLRGLSAWLVVVPLSCLGALAGHELAYSLTRTEHEDVHGYLTHAPQLATLLTVLAIVGAAFVNRGSRIALWPFPAVAVSGFVLQEHIERIAHGGSLPFLLDKPFFLVGLALQLVVAMSVWLVARLLVRVVGRRSSPTASRAARAPEVGRLLHAPLLAQCAHSMARPRAPPLLDR